MRQSVDDKKIVKGELPFPYVPHDWSVISTEGKTRNWDHYIKSNLKGYSDCQLVTACNAYYHLIGDYVDQDSEFYKEMAHITACHTGAAIGIERAWNMLDIEEDKRFEDYELCKLLKANNFFEIKIWHKRYGFHSIAAVDYSKKTDALRITGFKYGTSMKGWIFVEDLKPFLMDMNEGYTFRTFKKKEHLTYC